MLRHAIVSVVTRCTRHAWLTIFVAALIGVVSGAYAARHFAINTDIDTLISQDLPWRQREIAFEKAFPQHLRSILVVVEAPTPELTSQATALLFERLNAQNTNKQLFEAISQPGGGAFFRKNGLLFLPVAETEKIAGQLAQAEPLIAQLATDPSIRGLVEVLQMGLTGVELEKITLDRLQGPMTSTADTVEAVLANRPVNFSWHEMLAGGSANQDTNAKRKFIDIRPKLDFTALQPGQLATDAIRKAVADLKLASDYGARVRLTGPVPIADEEFATVQEGMLINSVATVVIVLVILWLALKSGRIIAAVFLNLLVGLAMTAALGFAIVGPLNLISIAFAVLFVGLGVDFGIQFSVRYRTDRFDVDDLKLALAHAARNAGAPLTLAATAVAAGFLSFLPTAYRGVSELGQIAGMGMLVAYVTSITLLPALLTVFNPKGEPEPLGFAFLAPVDRFMEDHRIAIIVGVAIVSLGGLPLLYYLQFDFNPINLRNPHVESIATFLDLRRDPITGANAISVLAPSLAATRPIEERLSKVPEVSQVRTLDYFVPPDQDKKLAAIAVARDKIMPSFAPEAAQKPPTDAEDIDSLNEVVTALNEQAGKRPGGPGAAAAQRLAGLLAQLAKATPQMRQQTAAAFLRPLKTALEDLKDLLQAHPVALKDVPQEISELWVTPDGRARVEVLPKGDPNDNETLRKFARAVLAVQSDATGGPISILESGDTIVKAFFQAGGWALISIAILLWIVLRRFGDVLLTIVPLLLAGVVTLELCVVIGMPLNFANIIALPLLLGVGVAFKIYYIMAWRAGQTGLLQSSLTRAVFYSAMTTATAFGSLWLSSHPGTSSMGKLLALSLITTLAAAVLFQPVLMGKPRELGEM
ncbi:MAG: MMPL family transporter [Alphaproteobacteria bacterium]|nr:MMPL family transporter [Alphaproteobacteria bacterium]